MRIGIGLGRHKDPERAAASAVRGAKKGVARPDLALVFGSVRLDQKKVHRALCGELDPGVLIGGSSYAEITPAGVTKGSVAVLLLSFDGVPVRVVREQIGADSLAMGTKMGRALAGPFGGKGRRPLGLLFSSGWEGLSGCQNAFLRGLGQELGRFPVFGGLTCGDYDRGMSHPDFWVNHQYAGESLSRTAAGLALLDFPSRDYRPAFGFEHGCLPVGPAVRLTRCDFNKVYEVDGVPIFDYFRQLLGEQGAQDFFELQIQRFGFSVLLNGLDERSLLKLPVECDFKNGSIAYYPADDMQGVSARLTQASRVALVTGAREAAVRCRRSLGGMDPALVLVVSCCTRNAILHSRMETEVSAVREVFGPDVPVFGYYSGGEIAPFLSRYEDVLDHANPLAGSFFHASTVCLLAIGTKKPAARLSLPKGLADGRATLTQEVVRLKGMLAQSETVLDNMESFLANLSRKSYRDGEQLRKQHEIIHRYTPHDVWNQIGANVARGQYELSDAEFNGCFFFMDVKGFTPYSEEHGSKEVVAALNEIFHPATEIIYECGGDVDKYIGDCIFAAFREPDQALEAGRRIVLLMRELKRRGSPFSARIGVNGGRAVRANVGAKDRREYTYIGDAVNLAQRLESNCAPGKILVSEELFRNASVKFSAAERREITVKGKKLPVAAVECEP